MIENEIPLLATLLHLPSDIGRSPLRFLNKRCLHRDQFSRPPQMGSSAGAAHLLKSNTGVLR